MIRSQNVIVDLRLLRTADNQRLIVPVFGRETLTLVRDRQEKAPKEGVVWYGKVANEPGSSVVLALVGQAVTGNIRTQKGRFLQIRYLGEGIHSIREIDQSKFPQEAQPVRPKPKPPGGAAADTCNTDPASDIDALVVYTAAARTGAGGVDAIESAIYLAVAETNQSYLNSQVTQHLRLAHFEEVTYTESGSINTDLDRLQDGADGFMDNVPTLRNTFAADTVSLITENAGACGLGFMMETVSNAFESAAYSVVKRTCATGNYSFGHELGHNMGADHDAPNATSTGPYPYNRGYVDTSPTAPATPWRTIMAYNGTPSSTRLQYWSNPNVNFPPGDPMGVSGASDNHQVLNNTALTVANFRCSSPGAANVWMKDTWNDTGAEPDPLTAAEPMWISPYIWARNSQDTNLTHQHQHENPQSGSTSWVYAKLHNGFNASTSGNLELYWANAAAGLGWPANWTLLATIPVASFAAHSTRVVEGQWNSVPGPGHFCLIARWVSPSDPMAVAETADINANVRGNNNIVWRNVNIVALPPDAEADAAFAIRNVDRARSAVSLFIGPPASEAGRSFTRYGQVAVRLDEALLRAWTRGGSRGKGFRAKGKTFLVSSPDGALFENLVLDPGAVGHVTLLFRRLAHTPAQTFLIDAIQLRGTEGRRADRGGVGGVRYEVHTEMPRR
ncbi:MAG TPA: M12 family metallo-peptidase [Thermoanaerobaculia bacterium]|nr:M12 family metallo-peptidase [Thermoanaerobaculia bacterium]